MKKIVIIIVVLLLLAGGGGGAYYYFFMMGEDEVSEMAAEPEEKTPEKAMPVMAEPEPEAAIKADQDYYVLPARLNVRRYPEQSALIRSVLRKGNKVTAKEVKGDWVRLSGYEVHESGRDIADWVHMDFLSADKPVITPEERLKTMTALLKKSDDFLDYQEQFIAATEKLIESGECNHEDFELVGGWITSVNYQPDPVYFVYCGGTSRQDKVYLNVSSGEIFKP